MQKLMGLLLCNGLTHRNVVHHHLPVPTRSLLVCCWWEAGLVPAVHGQYGTKMCLQHDVKSEHTFVASKASAP